MAIDRYGNYVDDSTRLEKTIKELDGAWSATDALKLLTKITSQLETQESVVTRAQTELEDALAHRAEMRECFDLIRDKVMQYIPELATGFSDQETVAMVDGELHVVKDRT